MNMQQGNIERTKRRKRKFTLRQNPRMMNKNHVPTIQEAQRRESILKSNHQRRTQRKKHEVLSLFQSNMNMFLQLNKQKSVYTKLFSNSKNKKKFSSSTDQRIQSLQKLYFYNKKAHIQDVNRYDELEKYINLCKDELFFKNKETFQMKQFRSYKSNCNHYQQNFITRRNKKQYRKYLINSFKRDSFQLDENVNQSCQYKQFLNQSQRGMYANKTEIAINLKKSKAIRIPLKRLNNQIKQ